eukprot:m.1641552 g.1641552  ORF g.1641552 m.1641552 type:complete len:109 (-) comp48329_c0_seq1:719-1045(-)
MLESSGLIPYNTFYIHEHLRNGNCTHLFRQFDGSPFPGQSRGRHAFQCSSGFINLRKSIRFHTGGTSPVGTIWESSKDMLGLKTSLYQVEEQQCREWSSLCGKALDDS